MSSRSRARVPTPSFVLSEDDLSLEEIEALKDDLSPTSSGKREVSFQLLSPPQSNDSSFSSAASSVSSGASASIGYRKFSPSTTKKAVIPDNIDSTATLEIIGLELPTAEAIFTRWVGRGNSPDELMDFVYAHFSRLNQPTFQQYTARDAMTRLGVRNKIQEAILDPRFKPIFETETLKFWLDDTFRSNYRGLVNRLHLLRKVASQSTTNKGKKGKRATGQGTSTAAAHSSSELPQTSVSTNVASQGTQLPANWITVEPLTPLLPGHYVLYKGVGAGEMLPGEFIRPDGSINLNILRTPAGGDFNHAQRAWYWTPERAVAEQYRLWAAFRSGSDETWLLRIQVKVAFMDSLSMKSLWFGYDWKQYVWYCRKEEDPPPKFEPFWESDMMKGHICTGVATKIQWIKKEEVQARINSDSCMRIPGSNDKATQWVIMQGTAARRLEVEIRGKIYITITAPEASQEP